MTEFIYFSHASVDESFFGILGAQMETLHPGAFKVHYFDVAALNKSPELFSQAISAAQSCDLVMADTSGTFVYFDGFKTLLETFVGNKKMFFRSGIEGEAEELFEQMGISSQQYSSILRYMRAGGLDNYMSMSLYIANEFSGEGFETPEAVFTKWQCLYSSSGRIEDEEQYLKT